MIFILSLALITVTVGWFGELYISSDKQKPLFWIVLLGFVIGMAILIRTRDFLLLIVGWEILGITSYLLVAGYLSSLASNGAVKTVLFNRIGDVFFVLVLSLRGFKFCWLFYLLVILFAICKSAQFPFSAWLPAAIAAPTPVSALVHSSTLVTAGLWILLKLEVGGLLIIILGARTIIIGAVCALAERDIKKVVAFSTLSQLGLLIIILSSFSFSVGLFHLITHAFFKSILFISIGLLIINRAHNQQGININGRSITISVIAWMSLLSIRGALFFGGFFSKHSIVRDLSTNNRSLALFVRVVLGSCITCMYRARLANSLLKQNKINITNSQQTTLLACVLLGRAIVPKFLPFERSFLSKGIGILSFLFLFWLWWAWFLRRESEAVSRIVYSSVITTAGTNFVLIPTYLDLSIFSIRELRLANLNPDMAKSVRSLFLVSLILLFVL